MPIDTLKNTSTPFGSLSGDLLHPAGKEYFPIESFPLLLPLKLLCASR
jgi:hypothetical protein